MARFTTVKCWHVSNAIADPEEVKQNDPSFSILKKSILKNGYRGFAIEDRDTLESQEWYTPFLRGEEVRFYLDGSGVYRLANCDLTENELYFERLNVPIGHQPWIFYSWQSDHNPARSKIGKALKEAVDHINNNHSPRATLEVVEATRDEDGAGDIVQAIKKNIDLCMFAIFDVTNISQVLSIDAENGAKQSKADSDVASAKCHPNSNVVFELSYALTKKNDDQILILKQNRTKDLLNDVTPFDFEHHRRVDFEQPGKLKADIQSILISYLKRRNFIQGD